MKALYARKDFDFKIEEYEPRKPGLNEVLVKVHGCGLCGTDLHFARDVGPDYNPLGHEISAEVVETGEGAIPYKPGDKVIVEDVAQCGICEYCKSGKPYLCRNMYDLQGQPGMSEIMTVDYHLLDKFDGIPWPEATLVEPMAVAYNSVLNARIPLGGNVIVVGPGPIGLLCVPLAKLNGAAKVVLVGTSKKRKRAQKRFEIGTELGADFIIEALEEDAVKRSKEILSRGADSVIVTSPPKTIPGAVQLTKFGGTVSFISINLGGQNLVQFDVNELIFNKITLSATFAEPAQNFPDTINIIKNKIIDVSKLITTTFSFDEAKEVFSKSDSGESPIVKAVFEP
jgi:threonine dehydrogenase-like Zn-dependent dehydrogenase